MSSPSLEPRPKMILVLSEDARMALVAMLVTNFAFLEETTLTFHLSQNDQNSIPVAISVCLFVMVLKMTYLCSFPTSVCFLIYTVKLSPLLHDICVFGTRIQLNNK